MLKARREAADQIAAGLFKVESSLSTTLEDAAALVQTMQTARRKANLSAIVGSDPLARVIACLGALGDANQEIVAAHHGLSETQNQVGLGKVVAFGEEGGDKPKDELVGQLSSVANIRRA